MNLYVNYKKEIKVSADKAVIRTSEDKVGTKLSAEEIYAVLPGEKITVEGSAVIMKITAR